MGRNLRIIKRNGNKQEFDPEKIKLAIRKSAERVMVTLTPEAEDEVVRLVLEYLDNQTGDAEVQEIHNRILYIIEQVFEIIWIDSIKRESSINVSKENNILNNI